jgi:hypothetical protein
MVSNAWKFYQDESGVDYSLQFTEVPWKYRKVLFDALKDWSKVAVGWMTGSGNQIFVFRKKFNSEEEWEKWADSFPLQIQELKYRAGKEKVVIHGKKRK